MSMDEDRFFGISVGGMQAFILLQGDELVADPEDKDFPVKVIKGGEVISEFHLGPCGGGGWWEQPPPSAIAQVGVPGMMPVPPRNS